MWAAVARGRSTDNHKTVRRRSDGGACRRTLNPKLLLKSALPSLCECVCEPLSEPPMSRWPQQRLPYKARWHVGGTIERHRMNSIPFVIMDENKPVISGMSKDGNAQSLGQMFTDNTFYPFFSDNFLSCKPILPRISFIKLFLWSCYGSHNPL